MKNRDRIGLELNPKVVRGVRVGRKTRVVEVPVAENREADALAKAVAQLGADASIRLVLRGLGVSTTRLLLHPPDEIGSVSEQIPIPERDATWHMIPLPARRTLLLAAQRRRVEEVLDGWGLSPSSRLIPDAVGLTLAALMTLESEVETGRDLMWIDERRLLHLRREGQRFIEARAVTTIPSGALLCGPGAWEAEQSNPGTALFRPGGNDSAFTLAWGAAHWGCESVPALPNLELRDRVEWRQTARQARTARSRAQAMALALLLLGGVAYGSAWAGRTSARTERDGALSERDVAESELKRVSDNVATRVGNTMGPGATISRLLEIVANHNDDLYLTELSSQISDGRFASLGGGVVEQRIRGRARTLEAVEALKRDLSRGGFDATVEEAVVTGRTPVSASSASGTLQRGSNLAAFAVDFQVQIR